MHLFFQLLDLLFTSASSEIILTIKYNLEIIWLVSFFQYDNDPKDTANTVKTIPG